MSIEDVLIARTEGFSGADVRYDSIYSRKKWLLLTSCQSSYLKWAAESVPLLYVSLYCSYSTIAFNSYAYS